jgi:anti-anti-sigma factor
MRQVRGGLTVGSTQSAAGVTLTIGGELDLATAPVLADRTRGLFDQRDPGELIVDMADLSFCDSAGIAALVGLRHQCDEHGWLMRLVNTQLAVRRILVDFTGLGDYLKVQ